MISTLLHNLHSALLCLASFSGGMGHLCKGFSNVLLFLSSDNNFLFILFLFQACSKAEITGGAEQIDLVNPPPHQNTDINKYRRS